MFRIKNGHVEVDEEILHTLNLKDGDFFEQKILKDGSIVFNKVSDIQLKGLLASKASSIAERLKWLAAEKPSNELLHLLSEVEKSIEDYEEVNSIKESENIPDFYLPQDRDLAVLKAVYGGLDTLAKISDSLKSPQSAVSDSLNVLHANNFIDYNRINDGKRGRPKHIYFLTWHGEQFCSLELE